MVDVFGAHINGPIRRVMTLFTPNEIAELVVFRYPLRMVPLLGSDQLYICQKYVFLEECTEFMTQTDLTTT